MALDEDELKWWNGMCKRRKREEKEGLQNTNECILYTK